MALKLGEAFALIGLKTGPFNKGLTGVRAKFAAGLAKMQAMAGRFSSMIGIALGAGLFGVMIKTAASFEQGMNRVKALTGASGDEMDALTAKAKELGRTTMFTARQSGDAMSYFALAGFDANKILSSMKPTLDLAAAGQIDVAEAADIMAKIMAGMGLEAAELTHVVDVLAKAFTTSNTDLRMLGEAMKFVGPVGKAAGKDIEELVAVIQVMSNAGIQGQMAGTSLRNMLIRLQAQPSEVKRALKLLNVEIADGSGRMKHFATIIDDVKSALQKYTMTERQAIVAALAGTRAMAAFSAVMAEGGDAVREMETRLQDAAGTAGKIAKIQMEGTAGAVTELKSAVEALGLMLSKGLLPYIESVTDALKDWTSETAAAGEETDNLTSKIGTLADTFQVMWIIMLSIWAGIRQMFSGFSTLVAGWSLVLAKMKVISQDTADSIAEFAMDAGKAARSSEEAIKAAVLAIPPSVRAAAKGGGLTGEEMAAQRAGEEGVAEAKRRRRRIGAGPGVGGIGGGGDVERVLEALFGTKEKARAAFPGMGTGRAVRMYREREERRRLQEAQSFDAQITAALDAYRKEQAAKIVPLTSPEEMEAHRQAQLMPKRFAAQAALGRTGRDIERVQRERDAARKTPEFTAIADFAKSIQSRIHDKKAVDLAKQQLDTLKKQEEIQKKHLKSIDDQLKKGIPATAG